MSMELVTMELAGINTPAMSVLPCFPFFFELAFCSLPIFFCVLLCCEVCTACA